MGAYGDYITAFGIIIAAVIAVGGWIWDSRMGRAQSQKEYAERIKLAAATTVAKMERWKELSTRFYQDIHPIIVQASAKLNEVPITTEKETKTRSKVARQHLFQGAVQARSEASQRILDEQIEISYRDLYGYSPKIHLLFTGKINEMKYIDRLCYRDFLTLMQGELIFNSMRYDHDVVGDVVGDHLRDIVSLITLEAEDLMEATIEPFRKQIEALINLTPEQIEIEKGKKEINENLNFIKHNCNNSENKCDSQSVQPTRKCALDTMVNAVRVLFTEPESMVNAVGDPFNEPESNEPESKWKQLINLAMKEYTNSLSTGDSRSEDALLWARWGFIIRSTNYEGSWQEARKCYELAEKLNQNLTGVCAGKALTYIKQLHESIERPERKIANNDLIDGIIELNTEKAKRLHDKKVICRNAEMEIDP